MSWWIEFNSVFWITITTIITGSVGLALKLCLKSKCDNVSCCWGGLLIHRNVDIEAQEEMKEMELGLSREVSTPNLNTNRVVKVARSKSF